MIPWKCDFGRNQRIQRNQLSVLWNFSYPYPYPETSLTLGMPRAYPIAQYTAYSLERLPYGPQTSGDHPMARRLPLGSPQHTQHTLAPGRAYPWYPAYTAFKNAPGATQTTRLETLPANREHNKMPRGGKYREYREKPSRGSLAEANQQTNKWGLYVACANKGARGWVSRYFPYKLCCCCTGLIFKENT